MRFFDRLNKAATKVYACRAPFSAFSAAHFLASCLFHTDSFPSAAHGAAMRSLARFMFIAIATN